MAEHEIHVEVRSSLLRRADGLIVGSRVTAVNYPGLIDLWLWLDRETGEMDELKPYRVGMFRRCGQ